MAKATNRDGRLVNNLKLGLVENSFMSLTPNRGGQIEHPRYDRLDWPTYQQVGRHAEDPFCGCD